MVIEYLDSDADEMLYSNLDDVDCHPHTFEKFSRILAGHGIRLPDEMLAAIQTDVQVDRGNHCEDWTGWPVDESWPELKCANCGRTSTLGWLAAERIQQRHEFGDTYSDKECPDCGALAFPVSGTAIESAAAEVNCTDCGIGLTDAAVYSSSPERGDLCRACAVGGEP